MKTGIRASMSASPQTELIGGMTENANNFFQTALNSIMTEKSKIPPYASSFKKEYLYIRGLDQEFKFFSNKLVDLNKGLFESKNSSRIKYIMKRFLRAQERGKIKDISNFIFPSYDIDSIRNILFINEQFELYKIRYDAFCDDSDDDNHYYSDDSDSDDDDDEYLVDGKPYPGFKEFYDIFKMIFNQIKYKGYDSDSDSDIDIDSDIDSDSDSD